MDGRPAVLGRAGRPGGPVAIAVDGRPIGGARRRRVHLALHKPAGVTSTVADRHAARTVLDLVPRGLVPRGTRLYPVGRLDRDSEGLLLLTNDGAWAERVLHPRHGVEREYAVAVARPARRASSGPRWRPGSSSRRASPAWSRCARRPRTETARLAALLDPRPAPG